MVTMNKPIATQNVQVVNAAASTGEKIKTWFGRVCSKCADGIKHVANKIKVFAVDNFKQFPQFIKSGYGVGCVGLVVGSGLAVTAACLNQEHHQTARVIFFIASCALFFTAGALMFAFGHNPVSFARPKHI